MRRAKWLVIGLALAAAVGVVAIWRSRPLSLLDRAQPVATFDGSWEGNVWLTDHSFILTHDGQHGYRVLYVDLATGVKTRLDGLERALSSFHQEGIIPSSDGKLLLCLPFDGEPDARVVGLRGAILQQVDVDGDMDLCWVAGTQRWLDLRWPNGSGVPGQAHDRTLVVREIDAVGKSWMHQWRGLAPDDLFGEGESLPTVCIGQSTLRCMRLSGFETGPSIGSRVKIVSHGMHLDLASVRFDPVSSFEVHHLAAAERFALSAAGDRVAWVTDTPQPVSLVTRLLNRLLRKHVGTESHRWTLWTSAPDGRGRREIASCSVTRGEDNLTMLAWLPGGRAVSFLQGGKLWRLDVR